MPSLKAKLIFVKVMILILQLLWHFFFLWYIVISPSIDSPICPWFKFILILHVTEIQISVARNLIFYSWVNNNKSNWGGIESSVDWVLYFYLAILFMIQKKLVWWRNKSSLTKTWEVVKLKKLILWSILNNIELKLDTICSR